MQEKTAKKKFPRPATEYKIPSSPVAIKRTFLTIHDALKKRAKHLKNESHDFKAKRAFLSLHYQRARCWAALHEKDPAGALALANSLNLKIPERGDE